MSAATDVVLSPLAVIEKAVSSGADPDKLERLFALYERDQATQARKAFDAAMARFQAECPPIVKATKGEKAMYSSLEDIMTTVRDPLSRNGLSIIWNTEKIDGELYSLLTVRHAEGHSETSRYPILVQEMAMGRYKLNESQAMGVANSYARRYNLCNALGLAPVGEDRDGHVPHAPVELISDRQLSQLLDWVSQAELEAATVAEAYGVAALSDLPLAKFDNALNRLKATAAQVNGNASS